MKSKTNADQWIYPADPAKTFSGRESEQRKKTALQFIKRLSNQKRKKAEPGVFGKKQRSVDNVNPCNLLRFLSYLSTSPPRPVVNPRAEELSEF